MVFVLIIIVVVVLIFVVVVDFKELISVHAITIRWKSRFFVENHKRCFHQKFLSHMDVLLLLLMTVFVDAVVDNVIC